MAESLELLQGTLDVLILKTLSWGPRHGYGIARWIRDTSGDALQIEEGSLYFVLRRLEDRGLISSVWARLIPASSVSRCLSDRRSASVRICRHRSLHVDFTASIARRSTGTWGS